MSKLGKLLTRPFDKRRYHLKLDAIAAALSEGDNALAAEEAVAAVRLAEALYGADDPETVTPRYALASARLGLGDLDGAYEASHRAVNIANEAPDRTEPRLPQLLEQLAAIYDRRGERDRLEKLFRKMLSSYARMREPDVEAHATVLNRLALLLARSERFDEAAPLFQQALDKREAARGKDDLAVAEVLHNMASYRPDGASVGDAIAQFRRALTIAERHDASFVPALLHNLGVALEEDGAMAEAQATYARALTAFEDAVGPNHAKVRPTLVRLARATHGARAFDEAAALYARALAIAEREGASEAVLETLRLWLGDARSETYR